MPYVELNLDDVDNDDLIEALETRGYRIFTRSQALDAYYALPADTPEKVKQFILDAAGRVA
jgi:hypothetical protein